MVEGGNHGMKRRNIILLISIPLGIMLIVQIITGNGILVANSEWIFSIQNTFLFILKWFGPILSIICIYGILKLLKKNE